MNSINKKRIFDLVFSSCVLFFGLPIYFILIMGIKISSKGPIFYKALRMGQQGKLIYCWKFRTMCIDADKKLEKLLLHDNTLREEWETYHKLKEDPRLTKMGKFLRKTSLDEFPQFWNVLKGDLSVVGPRPIQIEHPENALEEIQKRYRNKTEIILSIKPGITCIWQTQGRNHLTFDQRAALEELYVKTQSFWLDIKIILKTIYILFFPKGAY